MHPQRFALIDPAEIQAGKRFIPAHKNFRVFAIAAPVPPYTGYPIDPPFRSRFQARFIDPVGSMLSLQPPSSSGDVSDTTFYKQFRDIILATQYASETHHQVNSAAKSLLSGFPQTALVKLKSLLAAFPPPPTLSPALLARLTLMLHPALIHAPFVAWATLSNQMEDVGLGPLGSPSLTGDNDHLGYLGYRIVRIERVLNNKARLHFESIDGKGSVSLEVPAGPQEFLPFPLDKTSLDFIPTDRFIGLLTCMLQAHAVGWDISYVPPALPSTASCSTSTLVKTFGALLGYEIETVHMYKELGGRELVMRRRVADDGTTTWEPRSVVSKNIRSHLI